MNNKNQKNEANSDKTNEDNSKSMQKPDISIFKRRKNSLYSSKTLNINYDIKNMEITKIIINFITKKKRKQFFINQELNSLKYEYAIEIDDRTFIQYYWSLLKMKHLIIFTFIENNDYNIFLLKLGFFLLSFSLYFAVNAMFFTDDSIHKYYKSQGNFNISYQIPPILYSAIICLVINMFIKKLSLSQDNILKFKRNIDIQNFEENIIKTKKCLKIKFILFVIIGILLLAFFWYYLSTFCCVFVNTQIPLIKDTIISYIISMLYPFGLNLLPGILRIPSLQNNKRKIIYYISRIISII